MTAPDLRLMLVDEDPVFRLGLRIWLEQSAGCRVVAEASQSTDALAILEARTSAATEPAWSEADLGDSPLPGTLPDLDLVILDLGLGTGNPDQLPGLQLCGEIKTRYPSLPVLVLSTQAEPVLEAAARQMGADGFGSRGMPVRALGQLVRQLGQPRSQGDLGGPTSEPEVVATAPSFISTPNLWTNWRIRLRRSSLQQIAAVMAEIEAERRRGRSSPLMEAMLAGRYRELKAARWLMRRLLATPGFSDLGESIAESNQGPRVVIPQPSPSVARLRGGVGGNLPNAATLATTNPDQLALRQGDVATIVFERVFQKLQGSLKNTSDLPLEIDILRDDKKRELFYLTLRQFEEAVDNLRRAQVTPGQLAGQTTTVLRDLWEAVLTDFFGRYYMLKVDTLEQPVVTTLLEEADVVQMAILDRIPEVAMLLGHLLFRESVVIDGSAYVASTPEALNRSQLILENLLLQVSNAVVQPLLNRFADVELIKKSFYHRRVMSTRDIERFRNDLSWRYRWDSLVNEPRAVFESQYRLFCLTERGIQITYIYAHRREELEELSGLQRSVTLIMEARDAVAPRFRNLIAFVGSGFVYVLTDVIGRGIGLIGRGILSGIGGGWSDSRFRRDNQDSEKGI
jgi:DNA-binding NarL/FixJ family response regulator